MFRVRTGTFLQRPSPGPPPWRPVRTSPCRGLTISSLAYSFGLPPSSVFPPESVALVGLRCGRPADNGFIQLIQPVVVMPSANAPSGGFPATVSGSGRWFRARRPLSRGEGARRPRNNTPPMNTIHQPKEWRIVALRECPMPADMLLCDQPAIAAAYWKQHIATQPFVELSRENFFVLLLNVRRRILGHHLVAIGTLDTVCCHPREVFRAAILGNAHSVVLMHNHPSGDCSPSEADIRVTRDLVRAGQMLKIEVADHVILSEHSHTSMRELGHVFGS